MKASWETCICLILVQSFQVAYGSMNRGFECINGSYRTLGTDQGKPVVRPFVIGKQIYVDDYLELRCNVTANPKAQILWFYERIIITSEGRQNAYDYSKCNETLIVKHVEPGDTGRYKCQASNSYGKDSATVVVEVKQKDHSFFRKALPGIERKPSSCLKLGQTIRLTCKANGSKGICSWQKDNKILNLNSEDEACEKRCCLSIRNFSKADEGVYKCFMYRDVFKAELNITFDSVGCTAVSENYTECNQGTKPSKATQPSGCYISFYILTSGLFWLFVTFHSM